MMKPVAVAVALVPLLATAAFAEGEVTTTTAGTVVVVTQSAPVMVGSGPQAVAQPLSPPGAQEMPPAPTAPLAAPQNEDWNNVSHINGHPVPVGERGAYLYKFKKTNLMADPFGLFFGYYDVAGSYALGQNLAINASVSAWSVSNGSDTGYQVAASLPIYFRRTYSGPYLEPGLISRSTTSNYAYDCVGCSTGSNPSSNTNTWAGPELLFGWHWTFDSGLNIATAFGVAKHVADNRMDTGSGDRNDAVGYFRVGYAF